MTSVIVPDMESSGMRNQQNKRGQEDLPGPVYQINAANC